MLPLGIKRHVLRDVDREACFLIVVGIEVPAIKGITGARGISRTLELAVFEDVLVANNGAAVGVEAHRLAFATRVCEENAKRHEAADDEQRDENDDEPLPVARRVASCTRCVMAHAAACPRTGNITRSASGSRGCWLCCEVVDENRSGGA